MSKISFNVNITPINAIDIIKSSQDAELVHEEFNEIDNNKSIGTLIFEKYYFRTKNRAALIVIIDNINGVTNVRAIATGSSEGFFINFDWGAADNFVGSIEEILNEYIIK